MGNSEWAIISEKSVSGGIATVKCEEDTRLLLFKKKRADKGKKKKMPGRR